MKGTTKTIIIVLIVAVLAAGGILFIKQRWWKAQPTSAIAIVQKEKTPLDLRPAAIAKLQGLVKDASDGLYNLRIDTLETEIASGTIIFKGVGLYPDSNGRKRLHGLHRLPDDVFEIELSSLRITGIGLGDIIHRRDIHLQSISCNGPHIKVYHEAQSYNAKSCDSGLTLYQRIKKDFDRIAIDSVRFRHGLLTDYSKGRKNIFQEVSLLMTDILVDSAAAQDKSRCLFAKEMRLQSGKIELGDGNYDIGMGGIQVDGPRNEVLVRGFYLHPHGGKEAFARRQKERSSIYTIDMPLLRLRGANWWAAVNGESFFAQEAEISNVHADVYSDGRVPAGPVECCNFPQQKLMDVPFPVSIPRAVLKNATLIFEAFNPESNKLGRMFFTGLNMNIQGATNVPAEVAKHPVAHIHASSTFMSTTPLAADFALQLPRNKQGAFTVDIRMGALRNDVVNTFSEALGLVRYPTGEMQDATAHVEGNNKVVHGTVSAHYSDLHIEPLKPEQGDDGHLKEKKVTGKLANILFVKDNNPSHGNLRQPDFLLNRSNEANFFSFCWEGIKLGLLKMIGVPPKLGMKKK